MAPWALDTGTGPSMEKPKGRNKGGTRNKEPTGATADKKEIQEEIENTDSEPKEIQARTRKDQEKAIRNIM